MRPRLRQAKIAELVHRRGHMTVEALAACFDASKETIRRDLTGLAEAGLVQKFHGGAKRPRLTSEGPFQDRMTRNAAAKRAIAVKSAEEIAPGQSLFIDTGSTTVLCAEEIAKVEGLTVVTNSIRIAEIFAASTATAQVFLLGGQFDADNGETTGPTAIAEIRQFHADLALITIGALDAQAGAMDFNKDEADIARAMIDHSDRLVVVADGSKLERRATHRVCELGRMDVLLCDTQPPPIMMAALTNAGVTVR